MRRHKHNLSYYKLLTGDLGELLPVGLTEVLPGDSFEHSTSALIRLSPLAAPVMHPVVARIHHFFVPHRLVWEEAGGTGTFEDFITGGADGNDAQTVPTIANSATEGSVMDYLGLPEHGTATQDSNALPIAGFNRIFNEYYRDQDLVAERLWNDDDIPYVAWEKDYFTAARPWTQKGDDVTIPVAGNAPVIGIGKINQTYPSASNSVYETGGTATTTYTNSAEPSNASADVQFRIEEDPNNAGFPGIYADLSMAEAVKINAFREAFALQRYAEARARYGSRYTEYLRYLGVTPSDARLDRPEYLGGGKQRVAISEVLQTAPEAASPPVRDYGTGDMYGHGIAALRSNRYRKFFQEHGYVHTLLSLRPKAMYQNGFPKTFIRQTKEDFWQKELEHIGQEEILRQEIYAGGAGMTTTFGYQDRYRSYREQQSQVAGEFRSTLNYWHLARDFGSAPTLNEAFVECVPSKRIFNEQTQHSLWIMCQHRLAARRMVAKQASGRIL